MEWMKKLRSAFDAKKQDDLKEVLEQAEVKEKISTEVEWHWDDHLLVRSVQNNDMNMFKLIADAGWNIDSIAVDNEGRRGTALHLSVLWNRDPFINELTERNANQSKIGMRENVYGTPFNWARQLNKTNYFPLLRLLGLPAAINGNNHEKAKRILLEGHKFVVQALKADHHIRLNGPLHLAVSKGNFDMIKLLVSAGANLNALQLNNNNQCWTPLLLAIQHKLSAEIVTFLIQNGADPKKCGFNIADLTIAYPLNFAQKLNVGHLIPILKDPPKYDRPIHLNELPQLLEKKAELKNAQDVNKEIEAKEAEIATNEGRISIQNKEIMQLRLGPNYRCKNELDHLTYTIDQLCKITDSIKSFSSTGDLEQQDDPRACPICFIKAEQAYSCPACENWFCHQCQKLLQTCPSCRQKFDEQPAKRNNYLERVLKL